MRRSNTRLTTSRQKDSALPSLAASPRNPNKPLCCGSPSGDLYAVCCTMSKPQTKTWILTFYGPPLRDGANPSYKDFRLCTVVQIGKAFSRGLGCLVLVSGPRRPSHRQAMSLWFTDAALLSSYAVSLQATSLESKNRPRLYSKAIALTASGVEVEKKTLWLSEYIILTRGKNKKFP